MVRLGALALLLCSTLFAAPAAHASASDPRHPERREARAEAALDRVTSLLDLGDADGDLTLALRDLALHKSALPATEQARASTYLSRPTASPSRCTDYSCYRTKRVHRVCSKALCVHYVRKADDALNGVSSRDSDGDGVPNFVEKVLATMTHVNRTYVAAGYRRPMRDGTRGGDGRPDIYLAQIGDQGLYGYCTTDAPDVPAHGGVWAYCVLDNDYSRREFPLNTPVQNMQVTGAHEYFHAVQFGYDIGEDPWFMEATAVWMEDEVFDRVNDNTGYLPIGPMGRPHLPLDTPRGGYWYGAWIFFRHLTEKYPEAAGGLPILVRDMWRLADAASPDAPNLYSMAAVAQALVDKGTTVKDEFLDMAADNLHPRRWYDEGNRYPGTAFDGTWRLGPDHLRKSASITEDHLTSASYRFTPQRTGLRWHLQLSLDLAPVTRGSAAVVRVFRGDGSVTETRLELTDAGDYTGSFAFGGKTVKYVELTIADTSTRYNCNVGKGWSCQGRPLDQDEPESFTARAVRS